MDDKTDVEATGPDNEPAGGRSAMRRPRPGPRAPVHRMPETDSSRRWFLAVGGLVVLAGGAGVGAAFLRDDTSTSPPMRPPAALVAAVAVERALIADLDATTGGAPAVRRVILQARADHATHLAALRALLGQFDVSPVSASATASATSVPGTARTVAALRTAEQWAATAAAQHATQLNGQTAVLLASISACEATHAELFT